MKTVDLIRSEPFYPTSDGSSQRVEGRKVRSERPRTSVAVESSVTLSSLVQTVQTDSRSKLT